MSIQYKCFPNFSPGTSRMSKSKDQELDRIPQQTIDDLISQTDILAIIERDVHLKKSGRDYIGLCPFHKEHSPSFTVSPEKQFFYCFGCGADGNVMKWMQEFHKMSFLAVLQDMADKARTDLTPFLRTAKLDAKVGFNVLPALGKAKDFFQVSLQDSNPKSKAGQAREYLASRMVSDELIERFNIGFAGYGKMIVDALVDFQDPLIEAGVLDRGDHGVFSKFRDRVILPVRDYRGKTVALTGRALLKEDSPKYLNSKETPHFNKTNVIYGLYESLQHFGATQLERLVIVEGQFDVIAHHIIEMPAGGVMGSSLSIQQLRLIKRYTTHATFVFDPDTAGHKAMMQTCALLLESLTDADVRYDIVVLVDEDPHTLITTQPEAYKAALSEARPWLDVLIDNIPGADRIDTEAGQIEYATAAVELISTARDPLLRHQALEKASVKCRFPVAALNEKLMSLPPARSGQAKPKELPTQSMSEVAIRLARMLWDEPKWSESVEDPELWISQGDELTSMIGLWAQGYRKGEFDATPTEKEVADLAANPSLASKIDRARRARGAAAAFGRMVSMLPSHYMELLMRGEPETLQSLAIALSWHITAICAKKEMQELTKKAGLGIITADERERFRGLVVTIQVAAKRSRSIDT